MTDDADKGGEWVTGIIGEPFQIDADGKPIPNAPSEQPTELPSASDIWDAIEKEPSGAGLGGGLGGGLGDLMPTGILPERDSGMIGGGDDETQREIWEQMERGEFGGGAEGGSIPEDAETTI